MQSRVQNGPMGAPSKASRKVAGALARYGVEKFLGAAPADKVQRTPIAQARVHARQPPLSRQRFVDPQQARHNHFEQINPSGIRVVDPAPLPPAGHLGAAHIEQLGQLTLRAEIAT